jgi:hypothetical protein
MSRARAIDTADIALERGFVFDRAGNHVRPCLHRGGRIASQSLSARARSPISSGK